MAKHTVYLLAAQELPRYRQHLLQLDADSRYLRFGYAITDHMINRLCDTWEQKPYDHRVFVIENDDLEVIAAGHVSLADTPVELAFSVLKQYQGQGMGSALMARTIEYCQNRQITAGCMVCLTSNRVIKHLASKHGILINEGPETLAEIRIPSPDPVSLWHEAAEYTVANLDHLGKLQRKFAQMFTFNLKF